MKTYLQSHSSTMHVHKTDFDSWSVRNTNSLHNLSNKALTETLTSTKLNSIQYSNAAFMRAKPAPKPPANVQKHHSNFKT